MLLLDVAKRWLLVSRFAPALRAGICDQIDDRQSRAIDRQRAADIEVGQLRAVVVENDRRKALNVPFTGSYTAGNRLGIQILQSYLYSKFCLRLQLLSLLSLLRLLLL